MSWRKVEARTRKLRKLSRVFKFELKPQNAEHNGHWSAKDKNRREKVR